MKWKTSVQKAVERNEAEFLKLTKWHWRFAWFPIYIGDGHAHWLVWYECRKQGAVWNFHWEYRNVDREEPWDR